MVYWIPAFQGSVVTYLNKELVTDIPCNPVRVCDSIGSILVQEQRRGMCVAAHITGLIPSTTAELH